MNHHLKLNLAVLSLMLVVAPLWGQGGSKESCTSIMVGKRASTDGSVITSHTCDGRYRTWMTIKPAADYKKGTKHEVRKGTMHTVSPSDTTGVRTAGTIAEAEHPFAYLNTAYPCLNERQLAIGESTFGGPDTLVNPDAMFLIEELERIVLQRCTTARQAINLIGKLVAKYGYADGQKGDIQVEASADANSLRLVMRDQGQAFDALACLPEHGMDAISYELVDGHNVLTLMKNM